MELDGKPVLHVVYSETGFKHGILIRNKSKDGVWANVINCWASERTGSQETIRVDSEKRFHPMPSYRIRLKLVYNFNSVE